MRYLLVALVLALGLCFLAGCDDDNPLPWHPDVACAAVDGGPA